MVATKGAAGPHKEGGHHRKKHSSSGHGGMKHSKGKKDRMESKTTSRHAGKHTKLSGGKVPG